MIYRNGKKIKIIIKNNTFYDVAANDSFVAYKYTNQEDTSLRFTSVYEYNFYNKFNGFNTPDGSGFYSFRYLDDKTDFTQSYDIVREGAAGVNDCIKVNIPGNIIYSTNSASMFKNAKNIPNGFLNMIVFDPYSPRLVANSTAISPQNMENAFSNATASGNYFLNINFEPSYSNYSFAFYNSSLSIVGNVYFQGSYSNYHYAFYNYHGGHFNANRFSSYSDYYCAFYNCKSLIDAYPYSSYSNYYYAFFSSNIRNVFFSSTINSNYYRAFCNCQNLMKVMNIIDMRLGSAVFAFESCTNLSFVNNCFNVFNGNAMFKNCYRLSYISNFVEANSSTKMFENCWNIVSIRNFSRVSEGNYTFVNCVNLQRIDSRAYDSSNNCIAINNAIGMFENCFKLNYIAGYSHGVDYQGNNIYIENIRRASRCFRGALNFIKNISIIYVPSYYNFSTAENRNHLCNMLTGSNNSFYNNYNYTYLINLSNGSTTTIIANAIAYMPNNYAVNVNMYNGSSWYNKTIKVQSYEYSAIPDNVNLKILNTI